MENVFQKIDQKNVWIDYGKKVVAQMEVSSDKMKDFHIKGKLQNNNHYNQIQHGWSSTIGRPNVKGFFIDI